MAEQGRGPNLCSVDVRTCACDSLSRKRQGMRRARVWLGEQGSMVPILPLVGLLLLGACAQARPQLRFRTDGTFDIVQLTDLHYGSWPSYKDRQTSKVCCTPVGAGATKHTPPHNQARPRPASSTGPTPARLAMLSNVCSTAPAACRCSARFWRPRRALGLSSTAGTWSRGSCSRSARA